MTINTQPNNDVEDLQRSEAPNPSDEAGSKFVSAAQALWAVSAAAYLVFTIFILHQSMLWLLGYMADDGFYYLQTARHIAQSGKSTFDGINPTNGYHPGWMLLMTICAKFSGNREALVRLCLLVSLALHFGSSLLLSRAVRPYVGAMWAWSASAIWLLNPFPIHLALLGVETPLLIVSLLILVLSWQRHLPAGLNLKVSMADRTKPLILFALALADVVYARTDQIVLVLLILFGLSLTIFAKKSSGERMSQLISLAVVVASYVVAMLPWMIYSQAMVGTQRQDSSVMKQLWMNAILMRAPPGARTTLMFYSVSHFWFGQPITGLFGQFIAINFACLWVTACLLIGSLIIAYKTANTVFRRLTAFACAYLIILGCLYGLSFNDFQIWHFGATGLIVFLVVYCWIALAARTILRNASGQAGAAAVLWLIALGAPCYSMYLAEPHYPWQRDVYISQAKFEAEIPAAAKIGAINAGIPAFFSPHTVVNLDGLVNHRVVSYWQTGKFDQYLQDEHIEYVMDETNSLRHAQNFSKNSLPLRLMDSVSLQDMPVSRSLYSVLITTTTK